MELAALALEAGDLRAQARPTATDRAAARAADRSVSRPGDYIVAVINQELQFQPVDPEEVDSAPGDRRGKV